MLRALAAVFDLELWLSDQDVSWFCRKTEAKAATAKQPSSARYESTAEYRTRPRCFVKRVGTHRLLVSFAVCSLQGVALHLYHCCQPKTPWHAEHASWSEQGVCFDGRCRFCQTEGYERSSRFGSGGDLSSLRGTQLGTSNPSREGVTAAGPRSTEGAASVEAETENKSTWFLEMLSFVYHRVYVAVLTQQLDEHAAVRPEDLQKAQEYQLSFGTDLPIARMTAAAVPIDMSKVHRVLWQRQQDSMTSFYNTPTPKASVVSERRHTHKLPRGSASDPGLGKHLPRADSASKVPAASGKVMQRFSSLDDKNSLDQLHGRREPQMWRYYSSEVLKDSDLSDMEGAILQTLTAQV